MEEIACMNCLSLSPWMRWHSAFIVGIVAKERLKTFSLSPSLSKCVPIKITLIILNPSSGVISAAGSEYADFLMILETRPIKCCPTFELWIEIRWFTCNPRNLSSFSTLMITVEVSTLSTVPNNSSGEYVKIPMYFPPTRLSKIRQGTNTVRRMFQTNHSHIP